MKNKNENNEIKILKETPVSNSKITTLVELSEVTGINYKHIIYILSKHPVIKKRISNVLSENKENLKLQDISEFSTDIQKELNQNDTLINTDKKILIDTSICAVQRILNLMREKIIEEGYKIILLESVLDELVKLSKGTDYYATIARRLMHNIALHPETYEITKFEKNSNETVDNLIIRFLNESENGIILWSADKELVIRARMYNIKTSFFEVKGKKHEKTNFIHEIGKKKFVDLGISHNGKNILIAQTENKILDSGKHEIKSGDIIYSFVFLGKHNKYSLYEYTINSSLALKYTNRIILSDNYCPNQYKKLFNILKS